MLDLLDHWYANKMLNFVNFFLKKIFTQLKKDYGYTRPYDTLNYGRDYYDRYRRNYGGYTSSYDNTLPRSYYDAVPPRSNLYDTYGLDYGRRPYEGRYTSTGYGSYNRLGGYGRYGGYGGYSSYGGYGDSWRY
jgi:hypothetical protein